MSLPVRSFALALVAGLPLIAGCIDIEGDGVKASESAQTQPRRAPVAPEVPHKPAEEVPEPDPGSSGPDTANAPVHDLATLEARLLSIPPELSPTLDPERLRRGDPEGFPAVTHIGGAPVRIVRTHGPGTGQLLRIAAVRGDEFGGDATGSGAGAEDEAPKPVLHGPEWRFREDGSLASISWWMNDERHGPTRSWRADGSLEFEGRYMQGLRDGLRREFSPDGRIVARMVYVEEELEGVRETWDPDTAELRSREVYRRGQRHGERRLWDAEGRPLLEEVYESGVRHGPFREYPAEGAAAEVVGEFRGGRPHGIWSELDPDGKVISETGYEGGVRHGPRRVWNPATGRLLEETTYAEGKRTGPARTWFPGGQPESEGQLEGGSREGIWRYYLENGSPNDTWSGTYRNDERVAPLREADLGSERSR